MNRRDFLKLAGAGGIGLAVAKFAEPLGYTDEFYRSLWNRIVRILKRDQRKLDFLSIDRPHEISGQWFRFVRLGTSDRRYTWNHPIDSDLCFVPHEMTSEEHALYRPPPGIGCGKTWHCDMGHRRIFAGKPGERKLRCLSCEGYDLAPDWHNYITLVEGEWMKVERVDGNVNPAWRGRLATTNF